MRCIEAILDEAVNDGCFPHVLLPNENKFLLLDVPLIGGVADYLFIRFVHV